MHAWFQSSTYSRHGCTRAQWCGHQRRVPASKLGRQQESARPVLYCWSWSCTGTLTTPWRSLGVWLEWPWMQVLLLNSSLCSRTCSPCWGSWGDGWLYLECQIKSPCTTWFDRAKTTAKHHCSKLHPGWFHKPIHRRQRTAAVSLQLGHEGSHIRESYLWRLSAINNWHAAVWGIPLQLHTYKQSQSMGSDEEMPAPGLERRGNVQTSSLKKTGISLPLFWLFQNQDHR